MSEISHIATTRKLRLPSIWSVGAIVIALPIAVPLLSIVATLFSEQSEVWIHLRETVLVEYVLNTVWLLLCVGVIVSVVGIACAWLVATKEFFGRRVLIWALILPFAAPAYVVAYAYADIFTYGSPVAELSQYVFGAIPSIRSLPGAALVLGFTLYPYVYLFAYNAFAEQGRPLMEAASTLGASPTRRFAQVALPHARPAIAGGIALALMETAADFGVVDFFGVPTLTNGIFRTWYAQGEHQAAMQLAGWLFAIVVILVVLEQLARRGSHANPVSRNTAAPRQRLEGWRSALACLVCALPVLLGLLVPGAVLLGHALETGDPQFTGAGGAFIDYVSNSLMVGVIAAFVAVLCAIWLTYATRLLRDQKTILRYSIRTATLGYAIPGMVLAVGLIGPLTSFDRWLAELLAEQFDIRAGLILTGSAAVLIFVYVARFIAVAFNSCEGGMAQIHPNYDHAARSLGAGSFRLLKEIHLPIMTPAALTAMLLVFVDVIKELPATLILRPFNFETLATRAYRLASDERIAEASTAALLIVLVGLVPAGLAAWQNFGQRKA